MSETRSPLVLDRHLNILVDQDRVSDLKNELQTLKVAAYGLALLAHNVGKLESAPSGQLNATLTTSTPPPAVPNCFWWYSVSLINFLRVIGWVGDKVGACLPTGEGVTPNHLEQTFPAVKSYRDKIGAHFVLHKRSSRDTEAEKLASGITAMTWTNGRWEAGALVYTRVDADGASTTSEEISGWSLTRVQHEVVERFPWPFSGDQLEPGTAIRGGPGEAASIHMPRPFGDPPS